MLMNGILRLPTKRKREHQTISELFNYLSLHNRQTTDYSWKVIYEAHGAPVVPWKDIVGHQRIIVKLMGRTLRLRSVGDDQHYDQLVKPGNTP